MIEFHLCADVDGPADLGESTYIGTIEDGDIVATTDDPPDSKYGSADQLPRYLERLKGHLFDPLVDPIGVVRGAGIIPGLVAAVPAQDDAPSDQRLYLEGDWKQMEAHGKLTGDEWAEFEQWDLESDREALLSPVPEGIKKDYDYPDRFAIVALFYQANSQSRVKLAGSWDTRSQEVVVDNEGLMEEHLDDIADTAGYDLSNALQLVKHSRRPYIFNVVDTETQAFIVDGDVLQRRATVPSPDERHPELLA